MPEPKRPLKVFLCHAHADRDPVRRLYARLTQDGVDVWLDKEKLLGGEDWEYEIRNAVRESDIVVVCHSKLFNQKGFRQKEVKIALEEADLLPKGEIFIIPVRLEECDVLDDLKRWHWVDLFEDDGYERLVRALQRRADNIGATLQIKKSWLPKITSPRPKQQKPIEIRTPEKPDRKVLSTKDDDMPLPPEWQSSTEAEETQLVENPHDKTGNSLIVLRNRNLYISAGILLLVLILASVFGLPLLVGQPEQESTPTSTKKTTATVVISLTKTREPITTPLIPTSTKIPTVTVTLTPLPTEITDAKGVSMVLVPAGEFTMGSDELYRVGPAHTVFLDAFYIDKYEVSNAEYAKCVLESSCLPPQQMNSLDVKEYYGNPYYDSYPVIYVNWDMANSYCTWRGKNDNKNVRLPTEAEWEKSARSTNERRYPWGDSKFVLGGNFCDMRCPSSWDADMDDGYRELAPVSSFSKGVSPYGIYNMAGNVWEWVADWYGDYENEYSNVLSNPLGPQSGTDRVVRGGSWKSLIFQIETTYRTAFVPLTADNNLGFRCAKDAP